MMSEGAIIDWAALHLKGSLKLGAGLAATGFAAYAASMAASRFSGDRLRSRFGSAELVRASALLAAAGLVVALVSSFPLLAVAGFALVGLGLANLVPVFFGAAGRIPARPRRPTSPPSRPSAIRASSSARPSSASSPTLSSLAWRSG